MVTSAKFYLFIFRVSHELLLCHFVQGDQKHLVLAHLFDKPCFLGLLAVQVILLFISFYGIVGVFSFSNDFTIL